jgi:hypothetical protein
LLEWLANVDAELSSALVSAFSKSRTGLLLLRGVFCRGVVTSEATSVLGDCGALDLDLVEFVDTQLLSELRN